MTEQNEKGVWLERKNHEPQGGMILWRYPGDNKWRLSLDNKWRLSLDNKWRLSLAYKAKAGHYVDCGGAAGGNLADMTHFMEIPE